MSWTNPFAILLIKTVAPTAAVLSAAIVYWFGSSFAGLFTPERLAYIIVGASIYGQVAAYAYIPTAAIAEGKWSNLYPQVYITPASTIPYLAGRCLASFADSLPVVAASLIVSYYISFPMFKAFPLINITPAAMLMLAAALVVSLPAAVALGYLMGAYTVFVTKFEWALPSYVSGLLMIFSEALFPASVLPYPFSLIPEILPFTYLMRASRDALIYNSWPLYLTSMEYLALGGLIFLALGIVTFRIAENDARKKGFIDKKVM